MLRLCAFLFLSFILANPQVHSRRKKTVTLDLLTRFLDGQELFLNGHALHSRLIFPIYTLSLYLSHRSSNPEEILSKLLEKGFYAQVIMTFQRSVSRKDFAEAWVEGFLANCRPQCQEATPDLEKLLLLLHDLELRDQFIFDFKPGLLEIHTKAGSFVTANRAFARSIVAIWIGEHPPSTTLKERLLGHGKAARF